MIDTHAHLNFKAFEDDYEKVIKRAQEAGVEAIINVGSNLETSERAVELAKKFDYCYAAVGVHPIHWEVLRQAPFGLAQGEQDEFGELRDRLRKLARQEKVVAIGETGLDYFQVKSPRPRRGEAEGGQKLKVEEVKEIQKRLFKLHLELARELKFPLIIHNRDAHEDILDIIFNFQFSIFNLRKGVFHCFSGTPEFLRKVLKMGFYVGFDGNVTYKSAGNLRELVIATPLSRLLLETDCPYLSPEPLRNTKNEPKNVKIIGEFVANLKRVDFNKLKWETTKNAKTLFKI